MRKSSLKIKKRMKLELIFFMMGFIIICIKLFHVQFIKGKEYSKLATEQLNSTRSINSKRGIIYDSTK